MSFSTLIPSCSRGSCTISPRCSRSTPLYGPRWGGRCFPGSRIDYITVIRPGTFWQILQVCRAQADVVLGAEAVARQHEAFPARSAQETTLIKRRVKKVGRSIGLIPVVPNF